MSTWFAKKEEKPLVDILGESTRKYRNDRDALVLAHVRSLYQKTVDELLVFATKNRESKYTLDLTTYKDKATPMFDDSEIRAIALGVAAMFKEQNIAADHKFDSKGWNAVELSWAAL